MDKGNKILHVMGKGTPGKRRRWAKAQWYREQGILLVFT